MGDGAYGTYTKFQNLLRQMSATELANLFQLFGFDFVTTQWVSRVAKAGKFSDDVDKKLRPLVLRVEDLVQRAAPFRISFEDAEDTKLILDVLDLGVDIQVGASISINSSKEVTDNSADNPLVELSGIQ